MSFVFANNRSPFGLPPLLDHLPSNRYKDSEWSVTRLSLDRKLPVHSGCVNTVCWSSNGRYLLSGSDDRKLAITSPFCHENESHSFMSGHRANVFSAKFLPHSDDLRIVSAAGDGRINLTDLGLANRSHNADADNVRSFACHRATVFDVVTSPSEASVFLSVSADGTVRQFDVREPESGHTVLLSNQHCKYYGYTAAAVHPLANERLFVADKDGFVGEYDRRCIGYGRWVSQSKPVEVLSSKRLVRVTSLSFDPRASRLLASYNGGTLYLFDISRPVPHSQLTRAPNAGEDPLHSAGEGGASAAEESSRIIFRFRGDWSDTGPESEPPSERSGASDYSERLGQFMMRAYQLNRQRNPGPDQGQDQNQVDPDRDRNDPDRSRNDPDRDRNDPDRDRNDPDRGRNDPDRDRSDPNRDRSDPNRDRNDPDRDRNDPYRDRNDPYRDRSDPDQDRNDPNRDRNGLDRDRNDRDDPDTDRDEPNQNHFDQDRIRPQLELVHVDQIRERSDPGLERIGSAIGRDASASAALSPDDAHGPQPGVEGLAGADFRSWSWPSERPGLADSGSQAEAAADYPSYPVCRLFQGHRNARTCIQQAAFWGSEHVISGSDCGHFLVWRVSDGRLLNACLADQRVVNRVVPHPSLLYLATSGIDYDVKLWAPVGSGAAEQNTDLGGLVQRNQAMLAQTMNTVTVPGSAMLSIMRMLSRLYSRDAQ